MKIPEAWKPLRLTKRKLRSLIHDSAKTADAAKLEYINDKQKGISRIKNGKGFSYTIDGAHVKDKSVLARIKSLVLPPAWTDVWICIKPEGHLQATGIDALGRKQYRYHPQWNKMRSQTKFFHLHDFGIALRSIRKQLKADLSLPGLPQQKVLAAIISLMEHTGIRIGSNMYEKLYGSFGLTTLKDQHVKITGNEMLFSFKGKKGVYHNITMKSKKLARIVQQCRDIPGKELFQYYDENGDRKTIESGMVNDYIKNSCGQGFTSKDFRTWAGTLYALEAFSELGAGGGNGQTKKHIVEALDMVAKKLGNTRTVCKKYYVHPVVLDQYTAGTIDKYFNQPQKNNGDSILSTEEQVLMKMLEKSNSATITV